MILDLRPARSVVHFYGTGTGYHSLGRILDKWMDKSTNDDHRSVSLSRENAESSWAHAWEMGRGSRARGQPHLLSTYCKRTAARHKRALPDLRGHQRSLPIPLASEPALPWPHSR